ncbi:MAG: hypothetical protein AB7I24_18245 [Candidatus Nanopelagicales bacterium]
MRREVVERLADLAALVVLQGDPAALEEWATREQWSTAAERLAGIELAQATVRATADDVRAIRRAEVEDGLWGDQEWCELHGIAWSGPSW